MANRGGDEDNDDDDDDDEEDVDIKGDERGDEGAGYQALDHEDEPMDNSESGVPG